ncbi:hypothetical protein MHYP_G00337810 [Metynnis hypsauchen]
MEEYREGSILHVPFQIAHKQKYKSPASILFLHAPQATSTGTIHSSQARSWVSCTVESAIPPCSEWMNWISHMQAHRLIVLGKETHGFTSHIPLTSRPYDRPADLWERTSRRAIKHSTLSTPARHSRDEKRLAVPGGTRVQTGVLQNAADRVLTGQEQSGV